MPKRPTIERLRVNESEWVFPMKQAPHLRLTKPGSRPPGLPREPLTPEKQLKALRLVQDQAEQRVNLGMQLFKAAQAHTAHQQELIEEVKTHQEQMRHEMQNDIASSLHTYDQWMATFDENFTRKLQQLEEKLDQKIDALNGNWESTQKRILEMVRRTEALLDQSRRMLKAAVQQPAAPTRRTRPPAKPSTLSAACTIVVPATQKLLPRPKSQTVVQAQTTTQPSTVTIPASTANGPDHHGADVINHAGTGAVQIAPTPVQTKPAPNDDPPQAAPEQPDLIFSKALELLKAESANPPTKNV